MTDKAPVIKPVNQKNMKLNKASIKMLLNCL